MERTNSNLIQLNQPTGNAQLGNPLRFLRYPRRRKPLGRYHEALLVLTLGVIKEFLFSKHSWTEEFLKYLQYDSILRYRDFRYARMFHISCYPHISDRSFENHVAHQDSRSRLSAFQPQKRDRPIFK